jgi:hypothetical protein
MTSVQAMNGGSPVLSASDCNDFDEKWEKIEKRGYVDNSAEWVGSVLALYFHSLSHRQVFSGTGLGECGVADQYENTLWYLTRFYDDTSWCIIPLPFLSGKSSG